MSQPRGRKVAFSTKQKKAQLLLKREKKRKEVSSINNDSSEHIPSHPTPSLPPESKHQSQVKKFSSFPQKDKSRYTLVFRRETDEEVRQGHEESCLPVHQISEDEKEVGYIDFIPKNAELDMPKRPSWNYQLDKHRLEENERKYFEEYINNLEQKFGKEALNFDLNLENWRQLWRVLEMSDIILFIVDIRYPLHLFSPALFNYVTKELKKHVVLVMNKIDLLPAALILAWKEFMESNFPGLKVVYFASYVYVRFRTQRQGSRRKVRLSVPGSRELFKVCENIVNGKVDLSSWQAKIDQEAVKQGQMDELVDEAVEDENDDDDDDDANLKKLERSTTMKIDTSYYRGDPYFNGVLTLGCVGNPNVGKSAFLNAVVGKKVVSVSKTPGHTKHFQTIFVTPNIKICDCPGLVFPSFHSKALQAIIGSFPIASLRNPFPSVRLLFQRAPIHHIFKLQHPENIDEECNARNIMWSTYDLCKALAYKKGFLTGKAARPDVFRAAKYLLRLALEGHAISMYFYPSQYVAQKAKWNSHEDSNAIKKLQKSAFLGTKDDEIFCENESTSSQDDHITDEEESNNMQTNRFSVLMDK